MQDKKNITEAIKKGLEALPLDIKVLLYGSEARGDANPDSDINLLVLFNKPEVTTEDKGRIYDVTYPIELDTGVLIQPFILSKTQWDSRITPFSLNVRPRVAEGFGLCPVGEFCRCHRSCNGIM